MCQSIRNANIFPSKLAPSNPAQISRSLSLCHINSSKYCAHRDRSRARATARLLMMTQMCRICHIWRRSVPIAAPCGRGWRRRRWRERVGGGAVLRGYVISVISVFISNDLAPPMCVCTHIIIIIAPFSHNRCARVLAWRRNGVVEPACPAYCRVIFAQKQHIFRACN